MKKYFIVLLSFIFCLPVLASDNNEIIEQGSASYYFSKNTNADSIKKLDPFNEILQGSAMAGSMTRARTKCYFKILEPGAQCPDYMIGHAIMRTGTPRTEICNAAKRAVGSPRGCQRKHCTPCVYDTP